jgi:DNA-binding NarL/FixJ family response regulator
MNGDLISVRFLAVSRSAQEREVLREAAGAASMLIDLMDADGEAAARDLLAKNEVDIVALDSAVPAPERAALIKAARALRPSAFVILVAGSSSSPAEIAAASVGVDGTVGKPTSVGEAKSLLDRCARVRLPSRVLVVDDSATIRSIVRKILSATRFRLDIFEAHEGIDALKQIRSGKFDIVFLDYNMPGLSGVETLSEIKRQYPRIEVVMMTSAQDDAVAERTRTTGATAFLRKPFYPADIDAILHSICGLRMPRGGG